MSELEDKTGRDLEWDRLLKQIARHAMTARGAECVKGLLPAEDITRARRLMARTAAALTLLEDGAPLPVDATPDLGDFLDRVERGACATAVELRDLGRMLEVARSLRRYGRLHRTEHPELASAITSDPSLDGLLETLDRSIDPGGELSAGASPTLARARRGVAEARKSLHERLGQLISRHSAILAGRYYAEREGRHVLPVRTDAPFRLDGIVLDTSASGNTLYVEPAEVTALGNRLKVAEAEVQREQTRVLLDLTARVRELIEPLRQADAACVEADRLAAIARWSREAEAVALTPNESPVLDLVAFRHPLLLAKGADVVPNDIFASAGTTVVISGPNAGGKTVALKCLGLAALMARAGLPLPAHPRSRVGWFHPVLTDVGDEQSIARSLSSFSGHVNRIADYLAHAGDRALVLFDELAGGTDPEEGAALAAAVLEELVGRGVAVAVTTHYERLKEQAAHDPRFVNASVGFDLQTMQPTYRLMRNVPGPSSALTVAQRYGVPGHVLDRARDLVSTSSLQRDELIRRLESEHARAEAARRAAEQDAARQAALLTEAEAERRTAREKERARLSREAHALTAAVREARTALRNVMTRLRHVDTHTADELRSLQRSVDHAARQVAIGSPLAEAAARVPPPEEEGRPTSADLRRGTAVYVRRLGAEAVVVDEPVRGQVRLAAGSLKLTVPVKDLAVIPGRTKPRARPAARGPAASKPQEPAEPTPALRTAATTCDVRGLRAEEALSRVDGFIDRMLSEGEATGFVLHGHGKGALKAAIREHLTTSIYVRKSRPAGQDEGGDAFTIFWLAD